MDNDRNHYTPNAKLILELARGQADRLNQNFIGTKHLLLALIEHGENTAMQVLKTMGVESDVLRTSLMCQIGTGPDSIKIVGNIPYTPRVKKILALAAKSAREMNHPYVGTEHILLGLLREGDGVAAKVLKENGIEYEAVSVAILQILGASSVSGKPADPSSTPSETAKSDPGPAVTEVSVMTREEVKELGDDIFDLLPSFSKEDNEAVRTLLLRLISVLLRNGYKFDNVAWIDHVVEMITPVISDRNLSIIVQVAISYTSSTGSLGIVRFLQELYDATEEGDPKAFKVGILLQTMTNEPPRRFGPQIDYIKMRDANLTKPQPSS